MTPAARADLYLFRDAHLRALRDENASWPYQTNQFTKTTFVHVGDGYVALAMRYLEIHASAVRMGQCNDDLKDTCCVITSRPERSYALPAFLL